LLFVTDSEYEPAANPAGRVATSLWFVNDAKVNCEPAKSTVGASPVGLKSVPVIVIRWVDVLTLVL
jgi:hypothetical protein